MEPRRRQSEDLDLPTPSPVQKKLSLQVDESRMCPILVGVCGGSASGKTTLCNKLKEAMGNFNMISVSLDSFYRGLTDSSQAKDYNFDHPDAINFDDAYMVLETLMRREETAIPIYSFKNHRREGYTEKIKGTDIILFEGIFTFYDKRIRDMTNLKIFIQSDDDIRLGRRVLRDSMERGRALDSILYQYHRFVKDAFEEHIKPTMKYADLIIPSFQDINIAVDFIVQNLRLQLDEYGDFRKQAADQNHYSYEILENYWLNLNQSNKDTSLEVYCARNIHFPIHDNMKKEFAELFLLFNNEFSLDLYEMVIKRYMKASLRLLRLKAPRDFEKYDFITFPIQDSVFIKDPEEISHLCVFVIFLFQNAFKAISRMIDMFHSINSEMQISVVTGFSNIKYLVSLSHSHRNISIFNVLCVADFRKFYLSLKSNCEDSDFEIMNETNYQTKLLKLAHRYQKKHSSQPPSTQIPGSPSRMGKQASLKLEMSAEGKPVAKTSP